jgi:hypothetical protein
MPAFARKQGLRTDRSRRETDDGAAVSLVARRETIERAIGESCLRVGTGTVGAPGTGSVRRFTIGNPAPALEENRVEAVA